MRRTFLLTFFICLLFPVSVVMAHTEADTTKKCIRAWKENHHLDLSLALGDNALINSVQWDKLFPVALKKRIKLGFGIRISVANHWNRSMYTAEPQRTAPGVFDTLMLEHQTAYFANLHFMAEIALVKWWDVGMNIDLVGASWGPAATAKYYSSSTGNKGSLQGTRPETLNAMLFGKNDFGNLNSQFYMRFWPSDNVFIKAGMSLATFTNVTDMPLNNGNSRFHAGNYCGFVSLGWTPGRNAWVPAKKRTQL